jgi:hypothetical protein
MSERATLNIEVIGGETSPDTRLLTDWLQTQTPQLQPHDEWRPAKIDIRADAMPLPDYPVVSVLVDLASMAPEVAALATAIAAFLRERSDISLEITTLAGETTIRSAETAERIAQVIMELITAPKSGRLGSADTAGHAEENGQHISADIVRFTMPIIIYLSEAQIHEQVEQAVEDLLQTADLQVEEREEPLIGSWFRRMKAVAYRVRRSPAAREAALVAAHAADNRLILPQDAAITATLLQNLGPVITSLQPTKDAVLRIGALLIVKVEWVVNVFQLTAAQQALLDHQLQLASSPHEIIAALNLTSTQQSSPPAVH